MVDNDIKCVCVCGGLSKHQIIMKGNDKVMKATGKNIYIYLDALKVQPCGVDLLNDDIPSI